jgi:hypothetical protein
MAYLGSTPETQTFTSGTDYFNGDGISVSFTLSRPVASVNDIDVVVSNVVQQPSTAYSVSGTTITFTSAPPAGTANVYARYLSTATQTITPSPGTVGTSQFSPSLTNVPFFGGSTLGAGNATGMKNRIINGGMVLDQRNGGASITPTDTGGRPYALDRWCTRQSQASKFSIQQSAIAPTGFVNSSLITSASAYAVTSADQFVFIQVVEGANVADLAWGTVGAKTVTLSFQVRSSLTGTFGGSLRNVSADRSYPFSYTVSSANTWEQKSITIVGDTTGSWDTDNGIGIIVGLGFGVGSTLSGPAGAWAGVNYASATGATSVVGTSGATFYITGAQLEEGNAATSFEFRDYGRELAMCQRYYYQIKGSDTALNTGIYGYGFSQSTAVGRAVINFPVTMRSIPSALEQSGTANHYRVILGSSGSTDCSAVPTYTSASVLMADISWTVASGATANQGILFMSNNASSYLAWGAEL